MALVQTKKISGLCLKPDVNSKSQSPLLSIKKAHMNTTAEVQAKQCFCNFAISLVRCRSDDFLYNSSTRILTLICLLVYRKTSCLRFTKKTLKVLKKD